MIDVIESGEPAIMVCHWPGVYYNGDKLGFNILKEVIRRLNLKYDNLLWMKQGEIARYWAAKELTSISANGKNLLLKAPFAAKDFTLRISPSKLNPRIRNNGNELAPLNRVRDRKEIKAGTWYSDSSESIVCFNLAKGINEMAFA